MKATERIIPDRSAHWKGPARPCSWEPILTVDSSDRCLVLRAQSGDRGAFNLLVRKYRQRVMKVTLRYMHNQADAEETVQTFF